MAQAQKKKANRGLVRYSDGQWGVDYYDGPRRVRLKVGPHDLAKAYYNEILRRKRVGDVLPEPAQHHTMADLIDRYLAKAENPYSRKFALDWRGWIGKHRPEDITEEVLRGWVRGSRSGWAERTTLAKPLYATSTVLRVVSAHGIKKEHQLRVGAEVLKVVSVDKKRALVTVATRKVGEDHAAGATVQLLRVLAEATLYRMIAPLSACFTLGMKPPQLCKTNPCADRIAIGLKRLKNRRYRTLSPQEELRLLEVLGDRWWPYVQWAVLTAMRWGDQFDLRWTDVFLDQRLVVVPDVKGGKQLPIPLSEMAIEVLQEMRRRFPESEYCFPSPTGVRMGQTNWGQRYWRPALALAGIEGFVWHDLRRTAASRLISQGHTLYVVKELLGHEDQRTTDQHYARLANEAMRAAMTDIAKTMAKRPTPSRHLTDTPVAAPANRRLTDAPASDGPA